MKKMVYSPSILWLVVSCSDLSFSIFVLCTVCTKFTLIPTSFQFFALIGSVISVATVYKGNIIKNLIMDCQSYTKYRPNETTGGIFVSWRRKEELPTGA